MINGKGKYHNLTLALKDGRYSRVWSQHEESLRRLGERMVKQDDNHGLSRRANGIVRAELTLRDGLMACLDEETAYRWKGGA